MPTLTQHLNVFVGVLGTGVPKLACVRPRAGPLHQHKISKEQHHPEHDPREGPSLTRRSVKTSRGPPQGPSGVAHISRQGRASGVKGIDMEGQSRSRWQDETVSPLVQNRKGRIRVPKVSLPMQQDHGRSPAGQASSLCPHL